MLYLVWVGYAWWLADSVFNSDLPVCQRVNHATNYHIAFCVQHDISNDFGTLRRTRIANENLLIACRRRETPSLPSIRICVPHASVVLHCATSE